MLAVAIAGSAALVGPEGRRTWAGVLDEHPGIQYATRPTTDRVAKLNQALARARRRSARCPNRLSRVGARRARRPGGIAAARVLEDRRAAAYTSPHNPRAHLLRRVGRRRLRPGAPMIELAAHDPQQGVVFYTLDQTAAAPALTRQTSCLTCHVSASTLNVPGIIVRSNTVGDDGNVMPQFGSHDVNHETPHPDRWGGWFVTSDRWRAVHAARAHGQHHVLRAGQHVEPGVRRLAQQLAGNARLPLVAERHRRAAGLRSPDARDQSADPAELGVARRGGGHVCYRRGAHRELANELAEYLLFVGEAPPSVPLTPRAGLRGAASSRGRRRIGTAVRSAQLELVNAPDALSVQLHGVLRGVRRVAARR